MKTFNANPSGRQKLLDSGFGAVLSDENLEKESMLRRASLVFPLHVFPSSISPFINGLLNEMQGERSFVGMSILQAAASAIGSGLRPSTGGLETGLSIWSCMVGISSSGKSMIQKRAFKPLFSIQKEFMKKYRSEIDSLEDKSDHEKIKQKVIIVQDITYEALINDILQNNFKGITRYDDELVKWLEDMERYGKSNSEQSFWTSSWSPTSDLTVRRSRRVPLIIDEKHLVASVTGTTQPGLVYKFYENSRSFSGFAYRMLWTFASKDVGISPDLGYVMPDVVYQPWEQILHRLYYELDMPNRYANPRTGLLSKQGVRLFQKWADEATHKCNQTEMPEREIRLGILGKVREYVLRFSVVLRAMDVASTDDSINAVEHVDEKYVKGAIELGEYFLKTGWEAYSIQRSLTVVDPDVLEFNGMLKAYGYNMAEMAKALGVTRQAVQKRYKKYADKYPTFFSGRAQR